jgi:hypothetical protein
LSGKTDTWRALFACVSFITTISGCNGVNRLVNIKFGCDIMVGDGVTDISHAINGCADTWTTRHINIAVYENDPRVISNSQGRVSGIIGNIG